MGSNPIGWQDVLLRGAYQLGREMQKKSARFRRTRARVEQGGSIKAGTTSAVPECALNRLPARSFHLKRKKREKKLIKLIFRLMGVVGTMIFTKYAGISIDYSGEPLVGNATFDCGEWCSNILMFLGRCPSPWYVSQRCLNHFS